MKLGDIYLVNLPTTLGHEQMVLRPAIIMQEEEYNLVLPTVLIVPLTTKMKALDYSGTLLVNPSNRNNLSAKSVALGFQLRAIDKTRLYKKIGELEGETLEELKELIKKLLGE